MQQSATQTPQHEVILDQLICRSLFFKPKFLAQSNWLPFLPVAFWLTEICRPKILVEIDTQDAVSYFGFCQAVDKLAIGTRCYSVPQTDSRTLEKLREYNELEYPGFSRLLETSLNRAVQRFQHVEIDILSLPSITNAEQLKAILETWLPRLSDKGIILLPGTQAFDVDDQWVSTVAALKAKYSYIEYDQDDSLGIFLIGAEQPESLTSLAKLPIATSQFQLFQEVFARLGRACVDCYVAEAGSHLSNDAKQQIIDLEADCAERAMEIVSLEEQLRDLSRLNKRQLEEIASLTGQLFEADSHVDEFTSRLKQITAEHSQQQSERALEAERLHQQNAELESKLAERFEEIAKLTELLLAQEAEAQLPDALPGATPPAKQLVQPRTWVSEKIRSLKAVTGKTALEREISMVRATPLFDANWYLKSNPDVADVGADPAVHFTKHGGFEQRDPSPHFNIKWYCQNYPDVVTSGLNPLVHYLHYGKNKGYSIKP